MRLGVRPVCSKISGDPIDLDFKTVHPGFEMAHLAIQTVHPIIKSVGLFAQHLMPFNDNIELVLKILVHDPHVMLEVFSHHIHMPFEHLIDLLDFIGVYLTSQLAK